MLEIEIAGRTKISVSGWIQSLKRIMQIRTATSIGNLLYTFDKKVQNQEILFI